MPTYRVDPNALRRLASRLDDTVAELGDAATVVALLRGHGYGLHADSVERCLVEATTWGRAWTTSLADRAGIVERHGAIFDQATLVSAEVMDAAISGLDYATLAQQPLSFEAWRDGADTRQSDVARLGAWLETEPDSVMVAAALADAEPDVIAELTRYRPELIGSLSGAPLELRIRANHLVLTGFEARLSEQIRTLREASTRSPWARLAAAGELTRLRTDRALVRDLVGAERRIVFFDPGRPLRVGEWIGPLDAEHVVVLVPGAAVLGNPFEQMVDRARAMVRLEATGGELAVVVAQVYASPPNLGAALSGRYADVGGPELAEFVAGLPLAAAHLTLVGHSYGSTVIGEALHDRLAARFAVGADVVVLGSPGMRAETLGDLGLDPAHTWVGLAPGDEVQIAVRPLALPAVGLCALVGSVAMPAACDPTEWLVHGRNPAHPSFGARVFDTTPDVAPEWLRHDGYFATHWEDGTEHPSPALQNLLHIASGRYDMVTPAPES